MQFKLIDATYLLRSNLLVFLVEYLAKNGAQYTYPVWTPQPHFVIKTSKGYFIDADPLRQKVVTLWATIVGCPFPFGK